MTTETRFVYDNEGRLRTEIEGEFTRHYIYSHQGIEGYEENGERFIYRKNIFGDITAIYKGATKVAEYTYDAWGNSKIILDTNGYGSRNPFRYRGYYWDEDLKMYYLMTRYYDPKTGRFINADTPDYLDPKTLGGLNLYAYCKNNPVMGFDPNGHFILLIINHIINAINKRKIDKELEDLGDEIDINTAKNLIDDHLQNIDSSCYIKMDADGTFEIVNSYKVKSRYSRQYICEILSRTTLTDREYDNMSAEWVGHNLLAGFYSGAENVNLEYDEDPRWWIVFGSKFLEVLGWD